EAIQTIGTPCSKLSVQNGKWHKRTVVQSVQSRTVKRKYKSFFRMALADTFTQSVIRFLNKFGDMVQLVGSCTVITERKPAEEKIRQSDRELRQILDLT